MRFHVKHLTGHPARNGASVLSSVDDPRPKPTGSELEGASQNESSSPDFAEEGTEVQRTQKCLAPTSRKADGRGTWNPGRPSSAHTPALFPGPCGARAPVPGEAVRATLPGPQLRATRDRSTCRRAPRSPEARGSRLSPRPPASQAAPHSGPERVLNSSLCRRCRRPACRPARSVRSSPARRASASQPSSARAASLRRLPLRVAAAAAAYPQCSGPCGRGGGPRAARGAGRARGPGRGRWALRTQVGSNGRAAGGAGRGRGREREAPAPGSERLLRRNPKQRQRGPGTRGAGRECGRGGARCAGSERGAEATGAARGVGEGAEGGRRPFLRKTEGGENRG